MLINFPELSSSKKLCKIMFTELHLEPSQTSTMVQSSTTK